MVVKFHCPHCDGAIESEANISGYESACPHCGETIKTPGTGVYPGMVIDDMRIEKAIGRGSMGEVYLAMQTLLDRKVALKILNASLMTHPGAVDRFMKEVRLLAKLHHPNIVAAYSAGETMGAHYLAMSYVKGETMAARLQRKEKLPEEDALAVALCVARALNYAWERHHLLHRDIKPGNIMVDQDGEIKLMDMGLSKSLLDDTEGTQTGMLLGTPHYMSPEQADCRTDIDCRADIYGLGATLYHMLTGSPPYPGSTVPDIVQSQLKATLTPVRDRNPAISRQTATLVEKMMQKDREKRHQTWDELIADIEQILIEAFPSADSEGPLIERDPEPAPGKRRPLWPALLAILVALGGFDAWMIRHPGDAVRAREWALGLVRGDRQPARQPERGRPPAGDVPGARGAAIELAARRIERARKNGDLPVVLQKMPPQRVQAVIDTMRVLDQKAMPLIRASQFEGAAKLYEDYSGDFAAETLISRRTVSRMLFDAALRGTNAPRR